MNQWTYQTKDLISSMEDDMGRSISRFKVDGGASANDFLLQFQADVLDMPVCTDPIVSRQLP